MSWSDEDARQAEAYNRQYLLDLYAAGRYRQLCDDYCHEGWLYSRNDAGALYEAGICSYHTYEEPEELALAEVAAHIKTQVEQGILGC